MEIVSFWIVQLDVKVPTMGRVVFLRDEEPRPIYSHSWKISIYEFTVNTRTHGTEYNFAVEALAKCAFNITMPNIPLASPFAGTWKASGLQQGSGAQISDLEVAIGRGDWLREVSSHILLIGLL